MAERLQKLMAKAGLGSRRSNEALIAGGRVRVNGRVARLGDRANPEEDQIEVDGKPLEFEKPLYIMLHKPKGVISSTEDEPDRERSTVRDLVAVPGHIYPVGRLDKQSEGLILLTNDGQLAHRLTHPRYGHTKLYEVVVAGRPTPSVLKQWAVGVMLDGKMTAPAKVTVLARERNQTHLLIEMGEGRKRQIRRVAAMLGHEVRRLIRRRIGPLELGDLGPGAWRHLTPQEVAALRHSVREN